MTRDPRPADSAAGKRRPLAATLHELPVGWAALLLIFAATIWAVVASMNGFDYSVAAFVVVAITVGAIFGISAWDLAVVLFARRYGEHLTLPHAMRLNIPPRVVPFLTPVAFVVGVLIGHRYWG